MAASNTSALVCALLLSLAPALRPPRAAVHAAAGQPITLDAQSADYSNNEVVFRRVRISQGAMAIVADVGQGQSSKESSQLNFDDSVWTFRGNVKVTVAAGELTSDNAEIIFLHQVLTKAIANGRPATFEERVAHTGKVAHGHADSIDYDARTGLVRLLKNAWLTDGQTEVRGESIKYNLLVSSIVADSKEHESQQVHIVITPPTPPPPAPAAKP